MKFYIGVLLLSVGVFSKNCLTNQRLDRAQYTGQCNCPDNGNTISLKQMSDGVWCKHVSKAYEVKVQVGKCNNADGTQVNADCQIGSSPGDKICLATQYKTNSQCYDKSPVNGGVTAWTDCSVTCGSHDATQTRTCTNPSPAYGGDNCSENLSQNCGRSACPVDGGLSNWSACSVTCGGGQQTRTCDSPAPANSGADCVGDLSQVCANNACPENKGDSSSSALAMGLNEVVFATIFILV